MELEIIRSRRKTLGLEVKSDGRVIVRAPRWVPRGAIYDFVERNLPWIRARQRQAEDRRAAKASIEPFTEEQLRQLVKRARHKVGARAAYYAPLVGVDYGRIARAI